MWASIQSRLRQRPLTAAEAIQQRNRALVQLYRLPGRLHPLLLFLRLVNRWRALAATRAGANAAKTASRLAARKRRRLTAPKTRLASVRHALPPRLRLCRRRCRQALRPPLRFLRALWILTEIVDLWLLLVPLLSIVLLVLSWLGVGNCSRGPRSS